MRKWIGLSLALLTVLSVQVPAFAAEQTDQTQQVSVSLSTLEQILTEYNPDIQTIQNNLRIARNNESDAEGTPQAVSAQNTLDQTETRYEEQVQQKVLAAKQQYIGYCTELMQLQASQNSCDSEQRTLAMDSQALDKGYITAQAYQAEQQKAAKAKSDLATQQDKADRDRQSFMTTLNVPTGINVVIQPVLATDMDVSAIPTANYAQDLILMRGYNAEIVAAKQNYDYVYNNSLSYWEIQNAQIQLDETTSAQEASFRQIYDSMTAAYATYLQDTTAVQQKTGDLAVEKQKLSLGWSTQQKVDSMSLDLQLAQAQQALDQSSAYLDYLNYTNMKKGYAAASGSSIG